MQFVPEEVPYGERQSGKAYRLWLSPETRKEFTPRDPAGPLSRCAFCIEGEAHPQAYCPKAHQKGKERIHLAGFTNAAARNRVPPDLAEEVAKAMRRAQQNLTGWADSDRNAGHRPTTRTPSRDHSL